MALRPPDPPQASIAAVNDALQTLSLRRAVSDESLRSAAFEDMKLVSPHEVYTLGLDDLQQGRTLAAARAAGWRYLVSVDRETIAAAETVITPEGEHAFGQLNYGPFVAGTAEALSHVERRPDSAEAEIRLLHIPALYLMALWILKHGDDDVLVPIAPTPPDLEAGRAYPASELLGELTSRAQTVPATDEGDSVGA